LLSDTISYLDLDTLGKLELKAKVLDYVSDSVFVHDMQGKLLYVNKVAYESRGYTRDELLSMRVKDLDSADHESLVEMKMVIERMKQQGFVMFERNHVHKDGTTIPVEIRAQIFELQGHPLIISVARDIRERREKQATLHKMATTDPLTGLLNRHEFQQQFRVQLEKRHMYGTDMSLLMLDIDHFKCINDRCGHDVGDAVIIALARCLEGLLRGGDIIGRWGGEEFIILLPDTPKENAVKVAEKLRQTVHRAVFDDVGHLTVSIGVSSFLADDALESIVKRADTALYDAKNAGRNIVCSV